MTMINRTISHGPPELVLTKNEINFLDALEGKKKCQNVISDYIKKIAMLGGYLARNNDPPPGNMVIWRGMQKMNDMLNGYEIAKNQIGEFTSMITCG